MPTAVPLNVGIMGGILSLSFGFTIAVLKKQNVNHIHILRIKIINKHESSAYEPSLLFKKHFLYFGLKGIFLVKSTWTCHVS